MENDKLKIKSLVAKNMKKYRAKAGRTQEEAAEKAGLSLNYWQRLEMISQKDLPSLPTLFTIAKVLNVNLRDLLV